MRLVMKFGGTSVGGGARMRNVCDLVAASAAQGHSVVVVVSAMSGVTDTLIRSARSAAQGESQTYIAAERTLSAQYLAALDEAVSDPTARAALREQIVRGLDNFINLCSSVQILGELTPRASDAVASLGERLTAPILAQCLRERGTRAEAVEATELIVTDNQFTEATPILDATREQTVARLQPLLEAGVVPVVTGFIAATRGGVTTTLGRGGSDYSATLIAHALRADQVWIWTDVNGVMTADPRVVPEARSLEEISYAEAAELSYFGAKVIHPQTISPVADLEIPVRILNTFHPEHPGTWIVRNPRANHATVKAISAIRGLSLVTIEGRGMQGVPGIAAKAFTAVAREAISILMITQSSSEQNICFSIEGHASEQARAVLEKEFELERWRHHIDRIWVQDHIVIVAIVGAGMKGTPGIAARVFSALAERGLNIISIAQGSSEYNLSIALDEKDADEAVRAIHAGFHLEAPAPSDRGEPRDRKSTGEEK